MENVKDYPPYLDHPKHRKIQTNADKIRAMTDAELAAVLGGMCVGVLMCERCFAIDNCPVDKGITWEEWLKQPADMPEDEC